MRSQPISDNPPRHRLRGIILPPSAGTATKADLARSALPVPIGTLLCLNLPNSTLATIRAGGYIAEVGNIGVPLDNCFLGRADIVVFDVTNGSEQAIEQTRKLRSAMSIAGNRGRVLCISAIHRSPRFVLALQHCGARYVRSSDASILLEAIELLLAEIAEFERNRPCFRIAHRFSQGTCAPGEAIGIIEHSHNGDYWQLPLALSARFVFNCLAENQPNALDAFQIASVLSGGWFYRDHALNSGVRQTTKVRVATVKVLIQRIRRAIASTFAKAGLSYDPYEVLRSFNAEGSRRALYTLRAEIRWEHELR